MASRPFAALARSAFCRNVGTIGKSSIAPLRVSINASEKTTPRMRGRCQVRTQSDVASGKPYVQLCPHYKEISIRNCG